MRNSGRILLMLTILSLGTAAASGDEIDGTPAVTAEGRGPAPVDETHPMFSIDARWVGGVLIAIGGLFLAAMLVGPIVRAEAPDVVPAAMSHEEDPAADRLGHTDEAARS